MAASGGIGPVVTARRRVPEPVRYPPIAQNVDMHNTATVRYPPIAQNVDMHNTATQLPAADDEALDRVGCAKTAVDV